MAGGEIYGGRGNEKAGHEAQHILQKGQGDLNAVDVVRVRSDINDSVRYGERNDRAEERGCAVMPVTFAIVGTALAKFAEGAILAASGYLVSLGVRNPLKNRRK